MSNLPSEPDYLCTAIDHAPIGLAALSLNGYWLNANSYVCHLVGYHVAELACLRMQDMLPAEFGRQVEIALLSQICGTFETQIIAKNNSIIPIILSVTPVAAATNTPAFVSIVIQDICEKKNSTDGFNRWQTVFEKAQWGIVIGNADCTTLELMNPAFAAMHGYSVEELTGQPIITVTAPECRDQVLGHLLESHKHGHYVFESLHIRKDGQVFPVHIDITAIYGQNKEVLYCLANVQDISERRLKENALKAKEAQLQQAMRIGRIGLWEWDIVTGEQFWSLETYRIFGCDAEKDKPSYDLFMNLLNMEARKLIQANIHMALESNVPYRASYRISRPDGSSRYVQAEAEVVYDEKGNPMRMVGTNLDISEFKEIQDRLKRSEAKQRQLAEIQQSIFDALPALIAIIGSNGNIKATNRQWQLSGIKNDLDQNRWGIGSNYLEVCKNIYGNDGRVDLAIATGIRQILDGMTGQFRHKYSSTAPSNQRWFQMVVVPFASDGSTGAIIMHFDITDSHLIQVKLDAKEREFRTLAQNSPDVIARFDANSRYLYVNPAIEKLTGISVDKFLYKTNLESGMPEKYSAALENALSQIYVTKKERLEHLNLVNELGAFYLHSHLVPEFDDSGEITSVLVVACDVTTLKETEAELRLSRKIMHNLATRIEKAREQERKRIAGEVHDELGQILTALRMEVSLLQMEFGDLHPRISEKIHSAKELIDRTISVTRHIATTLRPAVLDTGIASALEWLAEDFSSRYNITCILDVEKNIQIDEDQATSIFRICQESLTNVARHASATKVKILLITHANCYELTIQDNGNGFKAQNSRKLDKYGLIGIQEKAIMLGGVATIDSQPSKGTIIFLNIPIKNNEKLDD